MSFMDIFSRKPRNESKVKAQDSSQALREALFGDTPLPILLAKMKADALQPEPWATFAEAEKARVSGESVRSIALLQKVLAMPNLESRMYLEAWQALRILGVSAPPEQVKDLLGVVVEYGLPGGVDLVAAWPDHSARYWNFSGSGVVWERAEGPVTDRIDELLRFCADVFERIGRWTGERPAPPVNGYARINLLTPSGLHFGFGAHSQLDSDPMAGPVLRAALQLMQALMKAQVEHS